MEYRPVRIAATGAESLCLTAGSALAKKAKIAAKGGTEESMENCRCASKKNKPGEF